MDELPMPFLISLKEMSITAGRKRVRFNLDANVVKVFQPNDCELEDNNNNNNNNNNVEINPATVFSHID
jgi:hypothetical protein